MQKQLNGLLLNEIVNLLLLSILIIMFIDSILERRVQEDNKNKDFSLFLLYSACYLGCLIIWLPIEQLEQYRLCLILLSSIRVFCGILAYSYIGSWLISIIEEKQEVNLHIKFVIKKGVFVLFALSLILYIILGNAIIANIPIFLFYLILESLVIFYHQSLGKKYTGIMSLFILPTLFLQVQEWWNYTPANIYLVLIVLIIYSQMWMKQKIN